MSYRTIVCIAAVLTLGVAAVSTDALAYRGGRGAVGYRGGGIAYRGGAYRGGAYRGGLAYRGGYYRGGRWYPGVAAGAAAVGAAAVGAAAATSYYNNDYGYGGYYGGYANRSYVTGRPTLLPRYYGSGYASLDFHGCGFR